MPHQLRLSNCRLCQLCWRSCWQFEIAVKPNFCSPALWEPVIDCETLVCRAAGSEEMMLDLVTSTLNLVVPPSAFVFFLWAFPATLLLRSCRMAVRHFFPEPMEGKVVLLTGATSGIGQHIALEYAKCRAKLVLVDQEETQLKEVAEKAKSTGAQGVHVLQADVSRDDECRRVVQEAVDKCGALDHLVCNARILHVFFFEEARDTSAMHRVMDITFWHYVRTTFYALPHLIRTKGKIVVVDSVAAWFPHARMTVYCAAKASMTQFFETLRVELGQQVGITIIQPSNTEKTKGEAVTADGQIEKISEDVREAQFGPMTETRSATVARATVNAARRGYRNVMLPSWYFSFLVYVLFIPEVVYSCLTLLLVVKWVTAQTRTIVHHLREASLVLLNQSKAKGDMSTGTPSIAPPFLQFEPKDLTAPLQAAKDYL